MVKTTTLCTLLSIGLIGVFSGCADSTVHPRAALPKNAKIKIENFSKARVQLSPRHSEEIISIRLPALTARSAKNGFLLTVSNRGKKKAWIQTEPKGLPGSVVYRSRASFTNMQDIEGANGIWLAAGETIQLQDRYQLIDPNEPLQIKIPPTKIDLVVIASYPHRKKRP